MSSLTAAYLTSLTTLPDILDRNASYSSPSIEVLPLSLNVSISRVQNFAHNISISMDKDKNKGVGEWVESWWIV
jgi:hypothetical protein